MEIFKTVINSRPFYKILYIIIFIIAILLVFKFGEIVGARKAAFGNNWGKNYSRTFGEHRGLKIFGEDYPSGHGAVGKIVKIELPQIIVAGKDNVEKSVNISTTTVILKGRDKINGSDLTTNDQIIIIGTPNQVGEIEAKLIRVLLEIH